MFSLLRVSFLFILFPLLLQAARIGVAPLSGAALSEDEARVSRSLLINELQKQRPKDLVSNLRTDSWMLECPLIELVDEARTQNMEQLVLVGVDRLGEKLILQLRLIDVQSEQNLMADSMPLSAIEDLDMAMRRAAESIARRKPLQDLARVGEVMQNEGLNTRTRNARSTSTWQVGYLWPIGDSYDGHTRRFTGAFSQGIEERNFTAGFMASWREGPAALLYSDWLIRPADICPFVGAAAGFHWARHRKLNSDTQLFSSNFEYDDGFQVALRGGLLLLRTYDFQMVVQTEYVRTFNDHKDRTWMLTLGIKP
ncbi:MAG: hypothetical protein KDC10_10350 [Calditrichaeota bacterium]|nr:hypothetical protein [Candidatus Cloacimonadota bacterium]MCA9786539.1 hypothetical protein [Candidatus Cloacimonadota bacterium]MCB1047589.1 hypothetical protein [Calditrichota bacterium]MCB9474132.1 hypothetical protein [Candidatus Delongbacteria bacterium]